MNSHVDCGFSQYERAFSKKLDGGHLVSLSGRSFSYFTTRSPPKCPCLSSAHTPSLHPCHAIQLGKLHNRADPAAETPGAHLWGSSAPPLTLTHGLSRQLLCSPHSASNPDSKPLQVPPSPSQQLLDDKFPVSSKQAACVIGKLLCMGHRASSPPPPPQLISCLLLCPGRDPCLTHLLQDKDKAPPIHSSLPSCRHASICPSIHPCVRLSVH